MNELQEIKEIIYKIRKLLEYELHPPLGSLVRFSDIITSQSIVEDDLKKLIFDSLPTLSQRAMGAKKEILGLILILESFLERETEDNFSNSLIMNNLYFLKEKLFKPLIIITNEFFSFSGSLSGITQLLKSEDISNAEKQDIENLLIDILPSITQRSIWFKDELWKLRTFLHNLFEKYDISMTIEPLQNSETPPWHLLLLADPNRSKVQKYLEQGKTYLARLDNEVVGVYVLLPLNDTEIELMNIAIAESEQGKGLGKQLIINAIQEAKNLKYQKLKVGTGNSSISEIAFYQKCGFQLHSLDKGFFLRNYPEAIFENGIQCVDMIRFELDL